MSAPEAIQAGFQEHEIVEEQLLVVLRTLVTEIRGKAAASEDFSLPIPPRYEVQGAFSFFKVRGIEGGFNVPETDLKIIHELHMIDQWRD